MLESLREGVALPTPSLDAPSDALSASPFETLSEPAAWHGPRRAGLSAFGFGGNDAHLIVEAFEPSKTFAAVPAPPPEPIAIVAMGARVGDGQSVADLERALNAGHVGEAHTVRLPMRQLRFPPMDLAKASAQQTMLLSAVLEATEGLTLPPDTTGVFVGYQCDPEIARWGARWRARSWAERLDAPAGWAEETADTFAPPLEAAHVLGTLPNVPANRISSQLDLRGPSYTTSSEEQSGIRALEIAVASLRRGDLDAALVGAVDLSREPVHAAAKGTTEHGDAAVVLVLRRRADAEAEGLPVLATVDVGEASSAPPFASPLAPAHAAAGLVEVACATLRLARSQGPDGNTIAADVRRLRVDVPALMARPVTVELESRGAAVGPFREASDAPALELPAHPAPVRLPALPEPTVERSPMQKMAPPPALPPTTYSGPPAPPQSAKHHTPAPAPVPAPAAPQLAAPMAAAAPVAPPIAPQPIISHSPPLPLDPIAPAVAQPLPADIPANTPLALLTEHQVRLAEAHRAFLEQQSHLHQQMLHLVGTPPWLAPPPAHPMPAPAPAPLPVAVPAPEPGPATIPAPPKPPAPVATNPQPLHPATQPPSHSPLLPGNQTNPTNPTEPTKLTEEPKPQPLPLAFRPEGPSFDRKALEIHAGGKISTIFGELFEPQDQYAVQVRMPEPPLLLADRCTGMVAEPASQGKGTCWTETDVREDSWYLHDGHMPCGIMVESGQADLFLISYLGADLLNQGERAYRLLGCEMTWLGDLPAIGETLAYDIHVDGHAAQGDVRLFFFHYDCHIRQADGTTRPALKVRGGQAGFFTTEELADSAGILWKPETQEILPDARVDAPAFDKGARVYEREQLEAFAAGRPWECFGPEWNRTQTHTRTPRIQEGNMLFLGRVSQLDPHGGPWGRGYLKAVTEIAPDDWFFEGHFKNDPCMPGTLMLEGCVQAMAFYLSAMGYTVDKDGWRFAPIPHETYSLRCRGQVTPESRELTYEVFVEEIHDGPEPIALRGLALQGRRPRRVPRTSLRAEAPPGLAAREPPAAARGRKRRSPRGHRVVGGPRGAPVRLPEPARLRVGPALDRVRSDVRALRRYAPHPRVCPGRLTTSSRALRRSTARWAGSRTTRPSSSSTTCPRTSGTSTRTARASCRSPCCSRPRCSRADGPRATSAARSPASRTSCSATSTARARSRPRCCRSPARSAPSCASRASRARPA